MGKRVDDKADITKTEDRIKDHPEEIESLASHESKRHIENTNDDSLARDITYKKVSIKKNSLTKNVLYDRVTSKKNKKSQEKDESEQK